MTDEELIRSFDKTARFYQSAQDNETFCVEYKVVGSNYYTTAVAAEYADRIRAFQKRGW